MSNSLDLDLEDETEGHPRGRCDTCGAPCDDITGKCTKDTTHTVALP